jgi:hypothetical protein
VIEVGTEIKSSNQTINIFPAYKDGAGLPTFNISEHGEFAPFFSLGVADGLRNFIAYPAIQKWAPTFRYGTLASVDYGSNTGNVNLETLTSSIMGLGLNQSNSLTNVPIEYMSCHAGAFESGDKVVVQFTNHDWSQPKIIGFKENPQPCGWEEPWDGPLYTSKYEWDYRSWFGGGTGTDATLSITDGWLTMSFPPTDYGSGSYEQEHYISVISRVAPLMENVQLVKFKAVEDEPCYDYSGDFSDYPDDYALFIGWNEDYTKVIQYKLRIFFAGAGYHIGCNDYYYDETDWIYPHSGVGEYWWWPEAGVVNWESYTKNIFYDKEEYIQLPYKLAGCHCVAIEMTRQWGGGAAYHQPKQISGGTMSVDFIGLA